MADFNKEKIDCILDKKERFGKNVYILKAIKHCFF